MAERRPSPPRFLWVVFDPDAKGADRIIGLHLTMREAHEHCSRANRISAYPAVCKVLKYAATRRSP